MGEDFKLPSSSYGEVKKIIQAYAEMGEKPVSLQELSKVSGITNTTISGNNGFLSSIGIIQGGKTKSITPIGLAIGRAFQFNKEEEITTLWNEIVQANDFLTKMVAAIRIRNGMDQQSFQSHIAYSSGQPNNKQSRTGSATIVELLKIAKMIKEEDGKLVSDTNKLATSGSPSTSKINTSEPTPKENTVTSQSATIHTQNGIPVHINIDIKIEAKIEELDSLGNKLKSMFKSLQEQEVDENSTVES